MKERDYCDSQPIKLTITEKGQINLVLNAQARRLRKKQGLLLFVITNISFVKKLLIINCKYIYLKNMCFLRIFDWPNVLAGAILGLIIALVWSSFYSFFVLKFFYRKITGTYTHSNVTVSFKHVRDKTFSVHETGEKDGEPIEWGGLVEMFSPTSFKGTYDWNPKKTTPNPDWGEYYLHLNNNNTIHSIWKNKSATPTTPADKKEGSVVWVKK